MRGLHIRDIAMGFGGVSLFKGVSIDIEPGCRVTVTGPNGSGKTTFLKIIAGLVRPTDGSVAIVTEFGRAESMEERRYRVGYAGPDVNPYDELTAIENLRFHMRLRGEDRDSVEAVLERVGLDRAKWNSLLGTFSSGMRQRVRIAISMLGSPPVLLWDEPTAMLDETGRTLVGELMDAHTKSGGIVLVATNDPSEIAIWRGRNIHFGGK